MYKILQQSNGGSVIVRQDNNSVTSFTDDPANTDYQAFLAWVAEGGQPEIIE